MDEYLTFNKKFHSETDIAKKLNNPVYHIHHGDVPEHDCYGISFSLLLNLSSVCNPEDKSVLWGFISKYAPKASPASAPFLDQLTSYAINYYNDFIKINKQFIDANAAQKIILQRLVEMLKGLNGAETAEEIQNQIYSIGMEAKYENLRDFFKELYQILLGQEQGPRLGSFFKLYGISDTIKLIESKIIV